MKNSTDFVHRIQEVHVAQGDQLISFDVVSLFTQVPVDEALHVLEERLNGDQTLEERTSIPVAQVIHLTELCLCSTFFQFGNHMRTSRGEDHRQTPEDTEANTDASEGKDPNGEEEKCGDQSICEKNAGAVTARACSACSGLCSSHKWCLEFARASNARG